MLEGRRPFSDYGPIDVRTLYAFGDMLLLVQPDFPNSHVWLLADEFKKTHKRLPAALSPEEILLLPNLHPATLLTIRGDPIP